MWQRSAFWIIFGHGMDSICLEQKEWTKFEVYASSDRSIFMRLNWLVLVLLRCVSLVILVFKVTFMCFQVLRTKYAYMCILESFGAVFVHQMDCICLEVRRWTKLKIK